MRVRIRHLVLLEIVVWGMVACSHLSLNAAQDPASDHQPDYPPRLFLTPFNSYEESELKEWNEIGRVVLREHTIPVPTTPSEKWMISNFEDNYLTNAKGLRHTDIA